MDSKVVQNKLFYFVVWLGYTPMDRTWELVENLTNATELVVEFHHQYPNKPRPSSCIMIRGTCCQRKGINFIKHIPKLQTRNRNLNP